MYDTILGYISNLGHSTSILDPLIMIKKERDINVCSSRHECCKFWGNVLSVSKIGDIVQLCFSNDERQLKELGCVSCQGFVSELNKQ